MSTNFYEELHARPFYSIKTTTLISAIAFIVKPDKTQAAQKSISEGEFINLIGEIYNLYDANGALKQSNNNIKWIKEFFPQNKNDKHKEKAGIGLECLFKIQQKIDYRNVEVILQKHTSFFYICFIKIIEENPPINEEWDAIPFDPQNKQHYIQKVIDESIFRTHLRVETFEPNNPNQDYRIKDAFNAKDTVGNDNDFLGPDDVFTKLYGSLVSDGGALVWTPFYSFSDNFNRILVRDISLKPGRLGRLVRRLLEIDLYVVIASKNFNNAREQLTTLKGIENSIHNILEGKIDLNSCYNDIYIKSKEIAGYIADTRYDFQATVAYSNLVWQRVDEFREERIEGWTRISFFLKRNFVPGVKTCESVIQSQMDVSQQIRGVSNLIEAGLSLALQKQEKSFARRVQIVALLPIAYYTAHIIDEIFGKIISWSISTTVTIIIAALLLFSGDIYNFLRKIMNNQKTHP